MGDQMACIIRSLVNHNVVAGNGTPTYFEMGASSRMKLTATVDTASQLITSYNIYSCKTSTSTMTQDQYIGSAIANNNATMTFKMNDPESGIKVKMGIIGSVTDGVWSSKSIEQWISFTSGLIHSTITQTDSALTSNATMSFSGQDIRLYSVSSLTGNTQSTYSLGEGTARLKVGSASEQLVDWDSTLADTSTHSFHYATVTAATIPSRIPTSSEVQAAAAFSSPETWDCQFSSTPSTMSSGSTGMQTDLQSCFQR